MEFLDTIFLDNTIKSYLAVLATILFVLLIKTIVSRYIASLLFIPIKRNWKSIEKEAFVGKIINPLSWFITVSVSIFAIDKLNFPSSFYFKIYGHPSDDLLSRLGICLIIIYFFWFFLSLIDFISLIFEQRAKATQDKADDQLIVFFRDFLKAIVTIFGILLVIKAGFNQNIGTLLTGLSIVGAAMALAARESLENLIASFVIFFDKPFFTGDTLKVNNVTGTVEHIGLRSTRIRTADRTLVTVPNKQMVDSVVDNLSMRNERRAELNLEFSPKTKSDQLEAVIADIKTILAKNSSNLIKDSSVFFSEFNKNGMTLHVEYITSNCSMDEYNQLKQEVNLSVKKLIEQKQLLLGMPAPDINIYPSEVNPDQVKSRPII